MKKLIDRIEPPCVKCLYKSGLVKTLVNPCPQCKEDGYQTFKQFQKHQFGEYPIPQEGGNPKV